MPCFSLFLHIYSLDVFPISDERADDGNIEKHLKGDIHIKMGRFLLVLVAMLLFFFYTPSDLHATSILISLNPLALAMGFVAGTIEVTLTNALTLYFYPGFFSSKLTPFAMFPDGVSVWSLNSVIGLNHYFSRSAPAGTFIGGGIIAGYMEVADRFVEVDGLILGAAYRFGYRWIWNHFSIAPNASIRFESLLADLSPLSSEGRKSAFAIKSRFGIGMAVAF